MNSTWGRVAVGLLLAVGIAIAFFYRDNINLATLDNWVSDAGPLAPLWFVLIYAAATVLFAPGSILTLAGGALFGPLLGTLYNLTGATLGAALAFLIARYLAGNWVANRAGGRLQHMIDGVEKEGWRFVAFVRLVPLFPFNILNYALGLTRIKFMHYLLATYVCMLPGALAYTYLGYAGREAVGGGGDLMQKSLLALALLAVVMFLPRFIRRLRGSGMLDLDELQKRLEAGADLLVLDVRTMAEFTGELGHIAGALNIPIDELPARVAELSAWQQRTVVAMCRTDRRSSKAVAVLAANGFSDVEVAAGGMTQWRAKGYPVA